MNAGRIAKTVEEIIVEAAIMVAALQLHRSLGMHGPRHALHQTMTGRLGEEKTKMVTTHKDNGNGANQAIELPLEVGQGLSGKEKLRAKLVLEMTAGGNRTPRVTDLHVPRVVKDVRQARTVTVQDQGHPLDAKSEMPTRRAENQALIAESLQHGVHRRVLEGTERAARVLLEVPLLVVAVAVGRAGVLAHLGIRLRAALALALAHLRVQKFPTGRGQDHAVGSPLVLRRGTSLALLVATRLTAEITQMTLGRQIRLGSLTRWGSKD